MSHNSNTNLLEHARELLEEIDSHPSGYDKLLSKAVEANDLDEVHRIIAYVEAELSQEHFHNNHILGSSDEY